MDLIADYAMAYGGPPDGAMRWHLFLALVTRSYQAHARAALAVAKGASLALGNAFGEPGNQQTRDDFRAIQRAAFPYMKPARPTFISEVRGGA